MDEAAPLLSVVLPAHNEEQMLPGTVADLTAGLREREHSFEVLIVENGSSDDTRLIADGLAAAHPEVRSLTEPRADYGRALRRGLLEATGTYVVNFDVDLYDLAFVDLAVERLRAGAAIVVGTKRGEGSEDARPWPRRLVTAMFSTVLRVWYGLKASDTHGMKVMDRLAVRPLAERCQLGTDLFDTELVLRAERAGLEVAEVGVRVEELRPARTSIVRRALRTVAGLVRLRRALRA